METCKNWPCKSDVFSFPFQWQCNTAGYAGGVSIYVLLVLDAGVKICCVRAALWATALVREAQ